MISSRLVVLGIDPGFAGAYALLFPIARAVIAKHVPMLVSRRKLRSKTASGRQRTQTTRDYDYATILSDIRLLRKWALERQATVRVYIEAQHSRVTDSKSVATAVGRNEGIWRGLVASLGLNPAWVHMVEPVAWKPRYLPAGADKQQSIKMCKKLYPGFAALFKLKKDEALAEAILIADYGWRKEFGLSFPRQIQRRRPAISSKLSQSRSRK